MIQTSDRYRRFSEKFSIKPLFHVYLLKFIKVGEQLYTVQSKWFIDSTYGLRKGFLNRKQNVENHWKHWVSEISVDLVNTKYRKHHRPSSDEFIVIHQSEPIERRRLSELIEMVQWSNWEGSSSYSVESEIKVSYTNRHSQSPQRRNRWISVLSK